MGVWRRPNRRDPLGLQPEICELCGQWRPVADLATSDVEGLRGRRICRDHGTLDSMPSYNDLGGAGNAMPSAPAEIEQHSGENWSVTEEDWP
jgi:hypothetical protein